ncbi:c-type cytochrome [Reyranella sp.]|uniref:c-type cytochrome n=1 Tax=Reyranella sp. TaxID=1929291 RepID=UPI003D10A843
MRKTTFALSVSIAAILVAGSASAQSGNEARGERLFNQQCKACHTLNKDGASTVGPNLHGLIGRKAGSAEGYSSSDAMKNSGIVWDDKTLVEYLKNPKGRVPGTKMVYAGLKQEAQQADMIAFLKKATQ